MIESLQPHCAQKDLLRQAMDKHARWFRNEACESFVKELHPVGRERHAEIVS